MGGGAVLKEPLTKAEPGQLSRAVSLCSTDVVQSVLTNGSQASAVRAVLGCGCVGGGSSVGKRLCQALLSARRNVLWETGTRGVDNRGPGGPYTGEGWRGGCEGSSLEEAQVYGS